jgi:uncharacterized membrane protein
MNPKPMVDERRCCGTCGGTCDTGSCVKSCGGCLSWRAILAGALVAIGLSFLLNLFGVGIGLSAFAISDTKTEALALAFGGYIAMVVSVMIAMFVAGWVAGFIAHPKCPSGCHGILYGFLTWCLALILSIFLVSSMGRFMSYQYNALSNANVTNITMTSNDASPLVSANVGKEHTTVAVSDEKAKEMSKSVFLLFLLFFAGALSACFGGYSAVKRCGRICNKFEGNKTEERFPKL